MGLNISPEERAQAKREADRAEMGRFKRSDAFRKGMDLARDEAERPFLKTALFPAFSETNGGQWGRGVLEHGLLYDSKWDRPYTGQPWQREERTRITRVAMDENGWPKRQVFVSKSMQSPENTLENARRWAARNSANSQVKKVKREEARKFRKVIEKPEDLVRTDTGALQEANERSYTDYRKYFR